MLVLARKQGQSIIINDDIELKVVEIKGEQVKLGIEAPQNIPIYRREIYEQVQDAMRQAAKSLAQNADLSELERLFQNRPTKKAE